ncbi:sulfatase [Sunxiuqinia indica]|uniref:sulfatase n=1 Tax=Sunxiuqinia indica TaxID=2692584 RepID=UPI001359EC86|nr:sulfatase [Sunxiuqinia indica]
MYKLLKIGCFIILSVTLSCQGKKEAKKPNVLFIAVDDLRPELGCYGQKQIISPSIDRLASGGLTFINAYCNVPVCGASRASLLTGMRPTADRFVGYATRAEEDAPQAVSLPEVFRNEGYYTISNGKVFHHLNDIRESWSEDPWNPAENGGSYLNYQADTNLNILRSGIKRGLPYEAADVDDNGYNDGLLAEKTINDLKRLKEMGKPFFLAAGFLKPHLPFNAPQKYWDMYEPDEIQLPDNYYPPQGVPKEAMHNFGELRSYYGVPAKGPVSDEMALQLIHGYYACVSYVDAQIGRVLDALDELGLADNTIVVLWGDHGWQLGEHSLWCKHANFKTSLNSPLIVKAPGFKNAGETRALVEFVDIFPSLCELANIDLPKQLQGKSFVPVLENPQRTWKDAVYSRYIRGESIKNQRYLYSEWTDENGVIQGQMIYDHNIDPDENQNIISDVSIQDTVKVLQRKLHQAIESRTK